MILSLASVRRMLPLAVALAVAAVLTPPLMADTYIDRVNAFYRNIREQNRSDLIILPAIANMDAPPAVVADPEKARLLPATASSWSAAREWATAQPQQEVLDALSLATDSPSRLELKAFGQPYGVDALAVSTEGIALIRAELYTDLGDPPMLAAAKFHYLKGLDNVACLVHVEATRRANEGDIVGAMNLVVDWLFFARQIADREFFEEARWGLLQMTSAMERVRDLAYQDLRGDRALRVEQIQSIIARLSADHLDLYGDRIVFPRGNRIAADHAVALTFTERGGPNPEFARTMARLSSHQRPLRLFAEAAAWERHARTHANWFDTTDRVDRVYNDWSSRWPLDAHDPRQTLPTDYERTPRSRFAAIFAVLPDMHILLNDRQVMRGHVAGTRTGLGVLAFYYRNGNFPTMLAAIRPTFVRTLDADPYNRAASRPPLEFFVPIRDQRFGEREQPRPHTVNVVTRGGQYNFQVRIGQDQFILYSVGPDGRRGWATVVSDEPAAGTTGDLILWPPALSLLRQRLIESGELR